jgi:hypothetical protein
VPDGQEPEHGQSGQEREGDEEAQPCVCLLPLTPNPRVSAGAVVVIGTVDRLGVDRRFFGWLHNVSGGLGHPGESIAAEAPS